MNTETETIEMTDTNIIDDSKKSVTTIRTKDEIISAITDSNEIKNTPSIQKSKTNVISHIIEDGTLDISSLSEQEKRELINIGNKLNLHDLNSVNNFGSELQKVMNDTSKTLLSNSRTSKVGTETEKILREMMSQIKEIDISEIQTPNAFIRFIKRIPILNKMVNSSEKFMAKYDTLEQTVERCEDNLHAVNIKAKADNKMLQTQFDETNQYIILLEKFIIAGKNKSNEIQVVIDEMDSHPSNFTPIQISDIKNFKHDLDLRLTNMLTWRTTFIQSLYRIREIQKSNISLSNNVQQTMDNMMPMLRHQLSEAVALYNLNQGVKVITAIQDGFNNILKSNADMTHDAVVALREQTENTVVRMETLRHTQERLMATMRDAQRVCEEGAAKRKEQEKELALMNKELHAIVSGNENYSTNTLPTAEDIEYKYLN